MNHQAPYDAAKSQRNDEGFEPESEQRRQIKMRRILDEALPACCYGEDHRLKRKGVDYARYAPLKQQPEAQQQDCGREHMRGIEVESLHRLEPARDV